MSKKLLYLTDRQATWLELFFDLIFVVALGKVTHFLTHVHNGHLDAGVWWKFFLVFIPLWWLWVGHTLYSNRFDADSRSHRMITLLLMSWGEWLGTMLKIIFLFLLPIAIGFGAERLVFIPVNKYKQQLQHTVPESFFQLSARLSLRTILDLVQLLYCKKQE